jgi:hypothetical protein
LIQADDDDRNDNKKKDAPFQHGVFEPRFKSEKLKWLNREDLSSLRRNLVPETLRASRPWD